MILVFGHWSFALLFHRFPSFGQFSTHLLLFCKNIVHPETRTNIILEKTSTTACDVIQVFYFRIEQVDLVHSCRSARTRARCDSFWWKCRRKKCEEDELHVACFKRVTRTEAFHSVTGQVGACGRWSEPCSCWTVRSRPCSCWSAERLRLLVNMDTQGESLLTDVDSYSYFTNFICFVITLFGFSRKKKYCLNIGFQRLGWW